MKNVIETAFFHVIGVNAATVSNIFMTNLAPVKVFKLPVLSEAGMLPMER